MSKVNKIVRLGNDEMRMIVDALLSQADAYNAKLKKAKAHHDIVYFAEKVVGLTGIAKKIILRGVKS